jgi:cell division protease FtsH
MHDDPPPKAGAARAWALFAALAALPFVVLLAMSLLASSCSATRTLQTSEPLSQLASQVQSGQIQSIDVVDGNVIATSTTGERWSTSLGGSSLLSAMQAFGVTAEQLGSVSTINETVSTSIDWFGGILQTIPFLLVAVVLLLVVGRGSGIDRQFMAFARSRARRYVPDSHLTRFEDVAGIDYAKQELQELVDFLNQPLRFTSLGARIPKGVLLAGPPGCGKTLLARAVAGEAGVPFLSLCGSEFVEMVAGVGASRVRDLFEKAKEKAPCIVFIDEIDAVGGKRDGHNLNEEREQTLNQILVEMDGFDSTSGVIVLAASNRTDLLDPALLRPGRFDRRVVIAPPDVAGRQEILKVHARHVPLRPDVDLALLAAATGGFSGAELANVINEAAILAVRHQHLKVGMTELEDAVDRVSPGEHPRHVNGSRDRLLAAYHVSGQVLVARALPRLKLPRRVGLYSTMPIVAATESAYWTRSDFKAMLTVLLAGRAAEQVAFGEVSTTASGAIARATAIARAMVVKYGMSARLGTLELARRSAHSDTTAEAIDREIHSLIEAAYARATGILTRQHEALDRLANALMRSETLELDNLEGTS